MRFYLGTHMPSWFALTDVPLFVSHRRLKMQRTWKRARGPWALDSGGFTELSMFGEWRTEPKDYAAAVARYRDEIGGLGWAAPMDWMCEPWIVSKTGKSVAEHQALTVANYFRLRAAWSDLPFIPVLQGWTLDDYLRCIEFYDRLGVDLTAEPVVGLGSVCRRQDTDEIKGITSRLAAEGVSLHGFGVKSAGLAKYAEHLVSADSLAWSQRGRNIRPCPHTGAASCANCRPHAMAWRDRLLTRAGSPTVGGR